MFFEETDLQLLTQIGFTRTQAKLYLALLKLGKTDGKTLSKNANAPRTVIYRTLDELQRIGLVEKEIATPFKFKATPLKQGLQILMTRKLSQYEESREKTEKLLLKMQNYKEQKYHEHEYKFTTLEGKERIIQIIKLQHKKVQRSVEILSTLQRWLQIVNYCLEDYEKALERKVKYRIIIEKPEYEIILPENVQALLAKPNFELKFTLSALPTNLGIFDNEEATINFFPSKSLVESPIILTNHPSFLSMCQDHFEKIWSQLIKA